MKMKGCTSLMFEGGKIAAFSSLRLREEGPMLRSSTGGRSLLFSFLSLQMIIGPGSLYEELMSQN